MKAGGGDGGEIKRTIPSSGTVVVVVVLTLLLLLLLLLLLQIQMPARNHLEHKKRQFLYRSPPPIKHTRDPLWL